MAKRAKTRSFRAKRLKACQGSELSKDRISEVPDAIIVYILSLLTMKEAGRTCVLSKRWRYVWSYIPVLNFEASDTIDNLLLDKLLLHEEKPRYQHWVNQVVRSYRGPTIDEFRVRFDLTSTSRYSIDDWVKFAMEKRVKRFELNFRPEIRDTLRCYTFCRGSLVSKSLTSLKLVFVNVTGEVLQNFLKNCPNLECLSVEFSRSLVSVTGEALNLRYLELLRCHRIQHIELSAPSLLTFNYIGPKIDMPFKITPKLSKLSIGGDYATYLISNSLEFSSYLFHLEALWMQLYGIKGDVMKYVDQFPVCTKLEQLELTANPQYDDHLFCFGKILKACPLLHKFVLTVKWFSKPPIESEWLEVEGCPDRHLKNSEVESYPHYHLEMLGINICLHHRMKILEVETCPHHHLKILEIVGFIGDPVELEFIVYLTETCIALEKIIIDPREPLLIGTPWEFQEREKETRARKKAEQLRTKLKPKIDLVIL